MIYVILFLGFFLNLIGIISVIFPFVPGGIFLGYLAILLLYWVSPSPNELDNIEPLFSVLFLSIMGVLHIFVCIGDYLSPIIGKKLFKLSNKGIWGYFLGCLIGFFIIPIPFGFIIGAIAGTLIGEYIHNKNIKLSIKQASYTIVINIIFMALKIILGMITFYYFLIGFYKILFH